MLAAFQRMEQVMQQQSEQIAQLTAQMLGQQQATTAAQEQVCSQQQLGEAVAHAAAAAAAAAVQSMRTNTAGARTQDNMHKYVEKPDAFLGTMADWERFKFSLSTWSITVDPNLPENLEACAKLTDEMSEVDMEDSTIELNHKLYVRLWTC